jgi:hypothetical protein
MTRRRRNVGQTCLTRNLDYAAGMAKYIVLFLVTLLLALSGCSTPSGSREYVPGKGWVPLNGGN